MKKLDKKKVIAIVIVIIIAILGICYIAGVFNTLGIAGTTYGEGSYIAGKDIPVGAYSVTGVVNGGPITYYGHEHKIVVGQGANVTVPEGVTITYIGPEK